MPASLDVPQPNGFRDQVDARHDDEDHKENEAHLIPVVDADTVDQMQADTTRADYAQDRRGAGVGFEVVQRVTQHHREDLWEYGKPYDLEPIGASGTDAFELAAIDVLNGFSEQLGESSGIAHGEGHDAGTGTQANDIDEHESPQQSVNATDAIEATAQPEVPHRLRHHIFGPQEPEHYGRQTRTKRAEKGHGEGLQHSIAKLPQPAMRGRRHHKRQQPPQLAQTMPEALR